MGDTMSSILESILNATIFRLFYYIERVLCWIIEILYQMFEVFAGLIKVEYNGSTDYLINIFFSNKAVIAAFDSYMRAVDPGHYSYENFGGIRYVFLRGVKAGSTETGIFSDRPEESELRKIQKLFEGEK